MPGADPWLSVECRLSADEQVYNLLRLSTDADITLLNPYKFGYLTSSKEDLPFQYGDMWAAEATTGPDRLVIAPRSNHVGLMNKLIAEMPEPFEVLYVFLVPRTETAPGRFQSPAPLTRGDLSAFLNRFQSYFECDGRHDVWVHSMHNSALLVYDRHNVIYAYGPLETFEVTLRTEGLVEVPKIAFPAPHTHHYNKEFDEDQNALLSYWPWIISPLTEQDED
jgi:hypothetical protein